MPVRDLTPDNKTESAIRYDRLKLKKDERARVVPFDKAPEMLYAHTLRAPELSNGKPVMMTDERSGDQVFKLGFIGQQLCLGNFVDGGIEKLDSKGSHPDACPICAESVDNNDVMGPQRKYALHVAKYTLKRDSFDIQKSPFQMVLQAWVFTDKIFNTLIDFMAEARDNGYDDLRQKDLLLGPCTQEQYQKFEIRPAEGKAKWLDSDASKTYARELNDPDNRCPDLTTLLGRKVQKKFMEEDLAKVLKRYRAARGADEAADNSGPAATDDVEVDMDGLLDAPAKKKGPSAKEAMEPVPSVTTESSEDVPDLDELDSLLT